MSKLFSKYTEIQNLKFFIINKQRNNGTVKLEEQLKTYVSHINFKPEILIPCTGLNLILNDTLTFITFEIDSAVTRAKMPREQKYKKRY